MSPVIVCVPEIYLNGHLCKNAGNGMTITSNRHTANFGSSQVTVGYVQELRFDFDMAHARPINNNIAIVYPPDSAGFIHKINYLKCVCIGPAGFTHTPEALEYNYPGKVEEPIKICKCCKSTDWDWDKVCS